MHRPQGMSISLKSTSSHDDCPTTPSKSRAPIMSSSTTTNGSSHSSTNNIGNILSTKLEALPRSAQFISLAVCVFFFFGIHNVIQESMVNTEGFTFGVMLGWMEVLGVTLCSGLERSTIPFIGNGESKRKRQAPWQAYPPLTICLLMSSSLASWSLNYINFPTKVVFRSCKLLPTMALAYVMGNAKKFTYVEVGSALAVCAGLITFAAGDWSLSKPQFHPFGLTLVTLSVFADAILPNAQEKLFRTYDASKSEVMFFTNIYTLVVQTASAFLSGDMMGMFHFVMGRNKVKEVNFFAGLMATSDNSTELIEQNAEAAEVMAEASTTPEQGEIRQKFLLCMLAYILISHIAVSAHTQVVRKFGGVAAVFVGTARKGMTLILSFVIFPKESNWKYAVGACLVLGGLTVASLEKQRNKKKGENQVLVDTSDIPVPPLSGNASKSSDDGDTENGDADMNGEIRSSERKPLMGIGIDVEMGRTSSKTSNGPERRR